MTNDNHNESIKPLRICCYGSSSKNTPKKYLSEAYELGSIIAKRGHICVNGAGASGCMASLNDGASAFGGSIIGVIHEMFAVDGEGAHPVFGKNRKDNVKIMVASGNDLKERKKLLVEEADGIVVLPGGPGTWDELWEMVCLKNIGIATIPIVCVNIDGYYESFRSMCERSNRDKMIYRSPEYLVHFEPTAELAINWMEKRVLEMKGKNSITVSKHKNDFVEKKLGLRNNFRSLGKTLKSFPTSSNMLMFTFGMMVGGSLMYKTMKR